MKSVLLTFAQGDTAPHAKEIANILKNMDINIFLDQDGINLQNSLDSQNTALKESQVAIVILSKDSLESNWLPLTIGYAIGSKIHVIAFCTEDNLMLPSYLNSIQMVTSYHILRNYFLGTVDKFIEEETVILNNEQTEKIINIHKESVMKNILDAVDRYIDNLIKKSEKHNDSDDYFFNEVRASILRSRRLISFFENKDIGKLPEYLEKKFPQENLRHHVNEAIQLLENSDDLHSARKILKHQLDFIQEELITSMVTDFLDKPD